jgi:hypothetical protein
VIVDGQKLPQKAHLSFYWSRLHMASKYFQTIDGGA